LKNIFTSFWKWRLSRSPEFGSLAGSKANDDKLETWTFERFEEDYQSCLDFRKQLEALTPEEVKGDELNARLLRSELDTFIDGFPHKGFLFPINFMEGPQADFSRVAGEWMTFEDDEDFRNLVKRYNAFPAFADGIVQTIKMAVKLNMTNCDRSMKGVVDTFQKIQDVPANESAFFEPFAKATNEELKAEGLKAIEESVKPGFKVIQEALTADYMTNLRPEIAATSLPEGSEFYKQCLKFHTSGNLSAQEIHQIGLDEVDRIRREMAGIVREIEGKSESEEVDLKAFIGSLRKDERFYFKSPQELMDRFKYLIEQEIDPKLTQLFWKPPALPLEIVEMPPALSGGPAAYYIGGTADGSRPGRFFVNVKRYDSQPKYEMISLALHEGNPGHHLQGSYSLSANLPEFRTVMEDRCYSMAPSRFPINTAFIEGWALYCESLGDEFGLYGDPYDRFGFLSAEVFRASRLVVDTGMHALGWSRQRAVDFMTESTAASKNNIEAEVDRYITWPGQAVGYKIGQIKIRQLRTEAETKLGDKFDVRDFHEVILRSAGPLDIIEQEIEAYIQEKLAPQDSGCSVV